MRTTFKPPTTFATAARASLPTVTSVPTISPTSPISSLPALTRGLISAMPCRRTSRISRRPAFIPLPMASRPCCLRSRNCSMLSCCRGSAISPLGRISVPLRGTAHVRRHPARQAPARFAPLQQQDRRRQVMGGRAPPMPVRRAPRRCCAPRSRRRIHPARAPVRRDPVETAPSARAPSEYRWRRTARDRPPTALQLSDVAVRWAERRDGIVPSVYWASLGKCCVTGILRLPMLSAFRE